MVVAADLRPANADAGWASTARAAAPFFVTYNILPLFSTAWNSFVASGHWPV